MRNIKAFFYTTAIGIAGAFAWPAGAVSPSSRMLKTIGDVSEPAFGVRATGAQLPIVLGGLVQVFITALGAVMLLYLIYGGYLWMTAQGDDKQVDKARSVIKNAIIGMVVVSLSFAISSFVLERIVASQVSGGLESPGAVTK